MKKITFLLFSFLLLILVHNTYSQKSYGGLPISYTNNLGIDIDHVELTQPDINQIMQEDSENEKNGGMHMVGRIIPVRINMNNSGTWTILEDGTEIWRVKISSPEAQSLTMLYKEFYLPEGSQLFLYNENRRHLLGAFDSRTNPKNAKEFSTQMIQGETTYLEYIKSNKVTEDAILEIEGVVYNYRDVKQFVEYYSDAKDTDFGSSGSCNVNINCPEGNTWQTQKKGVAVIYVIEGAMAGFCSGTLVNNTANDGKPYFLTADHCGGTVSAGEFAQWQFHFHFEATGCSNPATSPSTTNTTIVGSTFKSRGPNGTGGTDFLLLELSTTQAELATMNTYYNGWDRNTTPSSSGVSIHHPSGDIKKISTYTAAPAAGSFNACIPNGHWNVYWVQTATNYGITEGGSSGSPLFNGANKLVVGTLSGGSSACGVAPAQARDLYGRFDIHWIDNGTANNRQLKPWLDPGNTGQMTCPGFDPAGAVGGAPVANFTSNVTTVVVGGTVNFSDMSSNNPTSWAWLFPGTGVNPSSSSLQNPSVIYNNVGTYNVSLKATNANGNDTKTINSYITVVADANQLVAAFVASTYQVTAGGCINFQDQSTGVPMQWSWSFPGSAEGTASIANPRICYNTPGVYDVILTVRRGTSQDTYTCRNCITVLHDPESPIADFEADYAVVTVGSVVRFTNLSQNGPFDQWDWTFEGGILPSSSLENPPVVAYNTPGTFDVTLRCRKTNGRQDVKVKTNYIKVVQPATAAPTANFAANYTIISPGESINFLDFSTGTPHRWNWTFNGGTPSTSTHQYPTNIVYSSAGIYTVTLTVTNNAGSDVLTKEAYIIVSEVDNCTSAPIASFTAQNRIIAKDGCVYFQNTSTGNPTSFYWEFEGGTPAISTESSPSMPICYNGSESIYRVKLTATNNCGSSQHTKNEYVYVFSGNVEKYCETLTPLNNNETFEAKENTNATYGYIAGHSSQRIRSFATYFDRYTFNQIESLIVPISQVSYLSSNSYMEFCIWESNGNIPSVEPIAKKKVYLRDLRAGQSNEIIFDQPVQVDGPFYAGFKINYPDVNADNISDDVFVGYVITNRGNDPDLNNMYFYHSNVWKTTNQLYGFSSALLIKPYSCLVDVLETLTSDNIEIYPNPTYGVVNILVTEGNFKNFNIEVYDALGRKYNVKYSNISSYEYSMDMSNCPQGMYLIKVISGNTVVNKKLLLTK